MKVALTIDSKNYTLLKKVSDKVVTDVCKWKCLMHADMVCIENGIVYFYKLVGYDEEKIKNKNIAAVSS